MKQEHAVGFIDRGTAKEIAFLPEIAAQERDAGKECFPLCPTSYLQAACVLVGTLAPHRRSAAPGFPLPVGYHRRTKGEETGEDAA